MHDITYDSMSYKEFRNILVLQEFGLDLFFVCGGVGCNLIGDVKLDGIFG